MADKRKHRAKTQPPPPTDPPPEVQPDDGNPMTTIITRAYVAGRRGVEVRDGLQAQSIIEAIQKRAQEQYDGDDTPYIVFEDDNTPVYFAVAASEPEPLDFPPPGTGEDEYGTTSVELYGWCVTYPEAVATIIERKTRGKPTAMGEAKKIMTLALPIVVAIFLVFIMAVMLTG